MAEIFNFLIGLVDNYWGITLLMAIESSFIPFPSEVVIPPAAYLAYQGELNVFLVVFFGILGSLLGAFVNYFLALRLGKPLVYALVEKKWARIFLLNKSKVERAEKYFLEYGNLSTFLGRLVPAVRQLISLPAGFVKMNFGYFTLFTALGAGIWISILAALGYFFGANQELLKFYYREISLVAIGVVFLIILIVMTFRHFHRRKSAALS
ncbi:DedA family protein [Candidatus Peregrinibacteria bacterium]|nr:DedA family protein [Candidatus Peregrinibacteria bacterium]